MPGEKHPLFLQAQRGEWDPTVISTPCITVTAVVSINVKEHMKQLNTKYERLNIKC